MLAHLWKPRNSYVWRAYFIGIRLKVGIIPTNADPQTKIEEADLKFGEKAHR